MGRIHYEVRAGTDGSMSVERMIGDGRMRQSGSAMRTWNPKMGMNRQGTIG